MSEFLVAFHLYCRQFMLKLLACVVSKMFIFSISFFVASMGDFYRRGVEPLYPITSGQVISPGVLSDRCGGLAVPGVIRYLLEVVNGQVANCISIYG